MFDETALNNSIAETFCNRVASWVTDSGTTVINVTLDIEPLYDADGAYQIAGEAITASCETVDVVGMQRNEQLLIDGVTYNILAAQSDGNGWTTIQLEKT